MNRRVAETRRMALHDLHKGERLPQREPPLNLSEVLKSAQRGHRAIGRQRRRRRAIPKLPMPSASSASVPGSGAAVGVDTLLWNVIMVSRACGFADTGMLVSATIAARP